MSRWPPWNRRASSDCKLPQLSPAVQITPEVITVTADDSVTHGQKIFMPSFLWVLRDAVLFLSAYLMWVIICSSPFLFFSLWLVLRLCVLYLYLSPYVSLLLFLSRFWPPPHTLAPIPLSYLPVSLSLSIHPCLTLSFWACPHFFLFYPILIRQITEGWGQSLPSG